MCSKKHFALVKTQSFVFQKNTLLWLGYISRSKISSLFSTMASNIFSLIDQVVKTCRHPESPVVLGILFTEGDDQLEMWTETSNFTFKIHEGELYVAQRSEDDYSVGSINHDNLLDTLVSAVQSCFQHAQDDFHGDYEDGEFEQELEQFDPSCTYIRSIATACIERMNNNV